MLADVETIDYSYRESPTKMTFQINSVLKSAIYDCAKDFRRDANSIMAQLATQFDFDIMGSISFPKGVYRHYNNKGILRNEWTFYFHGAHCRFEHITTGQVLEVLFTHSPEFGYIDPFFLLVYIKTTEKHRHLAEKINDQSIYMAIQDLAKEGVLSNIENAGDRNLLLAL